MFSEILIKTEKKSVLLSRTVVNRHGLGLLPRAAIKHSSPGG